MESFEQKKELPPDVEKKEIKYNFEAIAELEKPMIELVRKLKERIENGEYDTLISDDAGGRIPTLILREIMSQKAKNEQFKKDSKVFFIAGGVREYKDEEELGNFIKKVSKESKKALLVTEYIETGDSIKNITDIFERYGLKNFDIASATVNSEFSGEFSNSFKKHRHEFFYGEIVDKEPLIYERRSEFGGAKKRIEEIFIGKTYSGSVVRGAHPMRGEDAMRQEGKGLSDKGIKELKENIKKARRENIKKARADVGVLSQKVIEQIWK